MYLLSPTENLSIPRDSTAEDEMATDDVINERVGIGLKIVTESVK